MDTSQHNSTGMPDSAASSQDFAVPPFSSRSHEWSQLCETVNKLQSELSNKLQATSKIMRDWEARLQEEQEACRDKQLHLDRLDKCRRERLQSHEDDTKNRYDAMLKSISAEKDAEIKSLGEQIELKDARIISLNEKISDLSSVHELVRHIAECCNIHTSEPNSILSSILKQFKDYEDTIKKQGEDLVNRLSPEDEKSLKDERDRQEKEIKELQEKLRANREDLPTVQAYLEDAKRQIEQLEGENQHLNNLNRALETQYGKLESELQTLRNTYQSESGRAARIRSIEKPCLTFGEKPRTNPETNEIRWLEYISEKCSQYGLSFLPRILYSFHTSLKTAEWSPITVLAGVSGTGKSELPRLYSHFGGMNFLNLSVQSNWDCQESMLGYFNTIENFFDAQPVLRLLAQSQKKWDDEGQGLNEFMTMILMDEMNLAHVELYFAEFLSKLEQRRGCAENQVPSLSVKLGANMEPYLLPLGRNVLWTGTMNQDETTKSLSDKVLDRSIVINFPRPMTLHSRNKISSLPENNGLLPRGTWNQWLNAAEEIPAHILDNYKKRIEQINQYLSISGRAIGHRVWQSIQNYMMNYPFVISSKGSEKDYSKALDTAFEDQLVQKIMPKLRGIETSGDSDTKCLAPIRQLLDEHHPSLLDDFDYARKSGYGQFIWNSASYLTKD